jgi:hypothetical protein
LQVTVKQHDSKDDKEGEHIDAPRITKRPKFRLYSVDPDMLIRVTVKNLSSTRDISLMPVYVKDNGEEEPEDLVELKSGECLELPFPLQKEAGEEEDGWAIKDSEGKTVLELRFTLPSGGVGFRLVPKPGPNLSTTSEQAERRPFLRAKRTLTPQPQSPSNRR